MPSARPPRLVVSFLAFGFAVIACVLGVAFIGAASVYALGDVMAARQGDMAAVWGLVGIGGCALVLAGAGSGWLARTLLRPAHRLTDRLSLLPTPRDAAHPRGDVSQEFDMLSETFDRLRSAVSAAEEESESAYLGVIGVLATALDARDPYTAGHSQRVSGLSVSIGEQMGLTGADIDVLRLGAMLHDIGKIGISDAVLRKPGKLTAEEFEQIKLHPSLGARILKPLKFLGAHVEIVELHHERPDGRGYPYGLRGDQIPLFARIVHVADAFDAMTSARAYRPGLPVSEAMAELWRGTGTDFDAQVVRALASLPLSVLTDAMGDPHVWDAPSGARSWEPALLPFRVRQLASSSDAARTA
jgi:putative nucleotidyltransferase with HDIG domain